MRVEPMAIRHLAEVAALSRRCFARGATVEELEAELARDLSTALVATDRDRVVGYAIVWVVAEEGDVHAIGVDPDARRRGIGRALLAAALEAAPVMHLEVRATNVAARGLYEAAGFAVVDVRRGYYADGEDAVLMTRSS